MEASGALSLKTSLPSFSSTPSFFQRISSAKAFGLISGWGSYKLTDLGGLYFYPLTDQDKRKAELAILTQPEPFALIVKRFDGERIPSNEMIGNILHQELSIPDSWKDRLAALFVKSAQFLGIIDATGYLRYDSAMQEFQQRDHTVEPPLHDHRAKDAIGGTSVKTDNSSVSTCSATESYSYVVNNKTYKIEYPSELPFEIWKRLEGFIQLIKPHEGKK